MTIGLEVERARLDDELIGTTVVR